VIDNPNPLFKMDGQSNPNPITIQLFLEKLAIIFGLKCNIWIDNPNQKSNFDFGLPITIQSNKLDCNPD